MKSGTPVESSTWSIGTPHNVGTFLPVNFCKERSVSIHGKELDTRYWRNGSFNEVDKKKQKSTSTWQVKDGKKPAFWHFSGKNVAASLEGVKEDPKTHFMRISGIIANDYFGKSEKVKIRFRVRGNGLVQLAWYCYDIKNGRRIHKKSVYFYKENINSKDWKDVSIVVPLPKFDLTKFAAGFYPAEKNAFMDFDEVYITEIGK